MSLTPVPISALTAAVVPDNIHDDTITVVVDGGVDYKATIAQITGNSGNTVHENTYVAGVENTTSHNNQVAVGIDNILTGNYDYLVGVGINNTVSAYYGIAIGANNTVSDPTGGMGGAPEGYGNVACGYHNTASGYYQSVAAGYRNHASDASSTAIGSDNTASGYGSTACGYQNSATSRYSIALGHSNNASNTATITIGNNNSASSYGAIAIGAQNTSSGYVSVAAGYRCTASSDYSIAIGAALVVSPGGLGIGRHVAVFGANATAIGNQAVNRIDNTNNFSGINIIRQDTGSECGLEAISVYTGMESIIMTHNLDLTNTGEFEIDLPMGSKFYPNEVGVILTATTGATVQPTIYFGTTTAVGASTAFVADNRSPQITWESTVAGAAANGFQIVYQTGGSLSSNLAENQYVLTVPDGTSNSDITNFVGSDSNATTTNIAIASGGGDTNPQNTTGATFTFAGGVDASHSQTIKADVQTTGLTNAGDRQRFTTLVSSSGQTTLIAGTLSAANASFPARFYFKGMLVESQPTS